MKKPLDLAFSYLLTKNDDLGVAIENVIDIKRFNSLHKLFRVTSCIKRLVNNLKKKVLKKETLKNLLFIVTSCTCLKYNGFQKIKGVLIKENYKQFVKFEHFV